MSDEDPSARSLSDREIDVLFDVLTDDERKLAARCEQRKLVTRAEIAALLAETPLDETRDPLGKLLLRAGKLSPVELKMLAGPSPSVPRAAPTGSPQGR